MFSSIDTVQLNIPVVINTVLETSNIPAPSVVFHPQIERSTKKLQSPNLRHTGERKIVIIPAENLV